MEIEVASELGFCSGVRRAIRILKAEVRKRGSLETLGAVVHNSQVMESLASMGIAAVDTLADIRGKTVVISSHGSTPDVYAQLKSRGIAAIDATCPIVRRAQREARSLARSGFAVVIFGDANHREVRGLLGWAGDGSVAVTGAEAVAQAGLALRRIAIISQTTQSRQRFLQFVTQVVDSVRFQELMVVNTLCPTTQKRQQIAVELARRSDLVLVIGGRNSANSQHLAEICSSVTEARLVESAAEIDTTRLGRKRIGIVAGASTAKETISEVVERLRSSHPGS
ncbi:MAG: 4-hydroxy-3-methylbut-2-enyl diphosphate reductase [Chloroflexota bacterium]